MKSICIILDPAHGEDVAGKRSPDGTHREYLWSRERCSRLKSILISRGYVVFMTTTSSREPGLSYRKNIANSLKTSTKKLFLSLHNNAAGSDGQWHSATGVSVWTSKGVTNSDVCADYIIEQFKKDFPYILNRRFSPKYGEKDFEENFTVLMGDYMAVLIEWLFQDNKLDVEKLKDGRTNSSFEESLVEAIEKINNHFSK